MNKVSIVLYGISFFAIMIIGSIDISCYTIWTVVISVIALIPAYIAKVIDRCLED